VSLRRIDPRFVLPRRPENAVVLGDLEEWREGLAEVGVNVDGRRSGQAPDLAVAPGRMAHAAFASGAEMVLLEGRTPPGFRDGSVAQRLLARPGLARPSLLIPVDDPVASCYAVEQWSVIDRRWKVARMRVASELLRRRRFPSSRSLITAAVRAPGPPFMVAAADQVGVPTDGPWVLSLGQGDVLSRNAFHIFPRDGRFPAWVLKFGRIAGYAESFERDARGLEIAARAGGCVAQHAPRLLGRFEHHGIEASVETAAPGQRLRDFLLRPGRREEKIRTIDAIASWVLDVSRETSADSEELAAERTRLGEEVVPRWKELGVNAAIVEGLPVKAVVQHNDLGSWNIVVGPHGFTALDWESAREHGLPLWDLFYFLADALAVLDGSTNGESRHVHTIRLFRGDLPSSRILFEWTRRAVAEASVPADAVGKIATLCWMHHSLSHVRRGSMIDLLARGAIQPIHGTERVGAAWLAEPALGETWDRWR
jgi:hypothetical protein